MMTNVLMNRSNCIEFTFRPILCILLFFLESLCMLHTKTKPSARTYVVDFVLVLSSESLYCQNSWYRSGQNKQYLSTAL